MEKAPWSGIPHRRFHPLTARGPVPVLRSPRITGAISPLTTRSTTLKQATQSAQRSLEALKNQDGLTIQYSSTSEVQFLQGPATKLKHSYTLGTGSTQLSVTQVEIVSVQNKRTFSLTAAGRTELFTPLEEEISSVIESAQRFVKPVD